MKNRIDVKHRVLFIGDIHGLSEWNTIALDGLKQFYKIVFLGDYLDSYFVRPIDQLSNLKDLIKFLRKNSSQASALIGNHDYAYIYNYPYISGHQPAMAQEYRKILQDNLDLFNIAWGYRSNTTNQYTLATHAGLTSTFWNQFVLPEFEEGKFLHRVTEGKGPGDLELHETLNYLRDKELMWKVGARRGGGGTPGPLWADYLELLEDPYPDINQAFGHTPRAAVTVDHIGENFLACIDSWGNKKIASLLLPL